MAETLAKEREEELKILRLELQEARESYIAAHKKAVWATDLVKQAGGLVNKQAEEANGQLKESLALAKGRELALAAQLSQAQVRTEKLEARNAALEARCQTLCASGKAGGGPGALSVCTARPGGA